MAATVTPTILVDASRRSHTYRLNFFGTVLTTTVTSTPAVIRRWLGTAIYRLRRGFYCSIVGLGVQWEMYADSEPAATLQICVGESCLIVQLAHATSVPLILRRFLADTTYTFVGFWNHSDASRLARSRFLLQMAQPPLDLRLHAFTQYGESLSRASVEQIVQECLGYEGVAIDSEISMSNWENYVLSEDQVAQATVDAYAAYLVGDWVLTDADAEDSSNDGYSDDSYYY